jgi:hypothetical protein
MPGQQTTPAHRPQTLDGDAERRRKWSASVLARREFASWRKSHRIKERNFYARPSYGAARRLETAQAKQPRCAAIGHTGLSAGNG